MEELIKELNELRDKFTGIKNEPITAEDLGNNEESVKQLIEYYKGKLFIG